MTWDSNPRTSCPAAFSRPPIRPLSHPAARHEFARSAGAHEQEYGQPHRRRAGLGRSFGACPRRTLIRARAGPHRGGGGRRALRRLRARPRLRRRGLDGGAPAHGRHRRRSSARSGSSGSGASRRRPPPFPAWRGVLGVLYISLHFVATIAFLVWVHRRRPDAFATVRTTLVVATGLALVGYLTFPAAPPRLAGLGFTDTVTKSARVNLSSDLLGALYNPLAAVPSLHFGYALLVGAGLAMLATRRWVQHRRRALPGRDALHHRRHRQPLLRRCGARRRGRRRRLARGPGARPRAPSTPARAATRARLRLSSAR